MPLASCPQSRPRIDLWFIDLDAGPGAEEAARSVLTQAELDRAARFQRPQDRRRHVIAHGAMRLILGAATGEDPKALPFTNNAWGKPGLALPQAPWFNLSHSGQLAALAVCDACPVGVDIEQVRRIEAEVADIALTPAERQELARLAEAQRLEAFYRGWTRKEAVVKALGLGVSQPFSAFEVSLGPDAPARLLRFEGRPDVAAWRLDHLEPAPGFVGAVAAPSGGHELVSQWWTWAGNAVRQAPSGG